ncbi:MAG: 4-hydroxythreonine-4-phosphate dehydrogenase PdxA [Deltaproteobacteria bacterium CG_4_10_14_0_2_um_filter_43_8]|nr:MAG: 4-hydroxythreonine-4-phosphate dehydrogenase PdxA [Deltaproteobacteria bacterium CG11_big_fil_rev_8_21_14_0_20_42_23]PJA19095.1 MAG: 4-hydroxythreonine-4-phosphate dehydrogenase PdxA [Deltaproteobacteria bacterium CG_4_10_14_0_2_um_filter_43_8]PJC64935.1 MAG: 4-hydroxythreonine-4-phosphate dehydrogenase PdxA [Deltaproteobacteria bacterium CG_4_9_14_0_2_um_filter_42_21]
MNIPHNIGISIGDPFGIGAEVVLKALCALTLEEVKNIFLFAPKNLIAKTETLTKLKLPAEVDVVSVAEAEDLDSPLIALESLKLALQYADEKKIRTLVTAPLNKKRITTILPDFFGHTEYLGKHCKAHPVMMFAARNERFKIMLNTIHVPLRKVCEHLDVESIVKNISVAVVELKKHFNLSTPKIAVLGINPHAGEDGHLGDEEKTILEPALAKLKLKNIYADGPFSADAFFGQKKYLNYDLIVAAYHDQGLIPAKLLFAKKILNITLGLPFLRVSPAHGTAEDIAWKGVADECSMLEAIKFAQENQK